MKLEDIPKKPIFNVPDGYFDQLPGKIQARIEGKKQPEYSFVFRYRLQYVLPVLVAVVLGALWLTRTQPATNAESMLASVDTEDLVAYLYESELTTEDVLDHVEFNTDDVEEIESEIYQLQLDDEVFDEFVNEIEDNI